jgi:putative sterol carrier protein
MVPQLVRTGQTREGVVMNVRELLEEHIAKRSNELPEDVRKQFSATDQMEMELSGAGGGTYSFHWDDGKLEIKEGPAETPLVRLETTARGFLDLMTGKYSEFVDVTNLHAQSQLFLDPTTFLTPKKADLLRQMHGTLCIQYCDGIAPSEDDILSEAYMAFNGETVDREDPRCRVIMPIGKLERVAKGEVTPPQLMVAGGMRVLGDMQMVIKMAPLLR